MSIIKYVTLYKKLLLMTFGTTLVLTDRTRWLVRSTDGM